MAVPAAAVPSASVLVGYEPPMKQRRLTVAFRVILAIPHFLFLWVLSIVSQIVIIISWFIAIFLGRIPEGMHSFITRVVRYVTRVYAYELLLTDRYPPFDLSSEDYPVSVDVPQSRLSRLAVFFRIVLQIPASLLLLLVSAGLQIASFFIWLIVLIVGSMPRSLFEAVAATLRFQTRYYAYMALLTPAYPSGLFGDRPAGQAPPVARATPVPPPPMPPASLQEDQPPPGYLSSPPAPPTPLARPRATRLVLSR